MTIGRCLRAEAALTAKVGALATGLLGLLTAAVVAAADGDLRLVDAARKNDQQTVRALLKQRADVNVRATTALRLLWAAHGTISSPILLIRAVADVNVSNDFGQPHCRCVAPTPRRAHRSAAEGGANPNTRSPRANATDDVRGHRKCRRGSHADRRGADVACEETSQGRRR